MRFKREREKRKIQPNVFKQNRVRFRLEATLNLESVSCRLIFSKQRIKRLSNVPRALLRLTNNARLFFYFCSYISFLSSDDIVRTTTSRVGFVESQEAHFEPQRSTSHAVQLLPKMNILRTASANCFVPNDLTLATVVHLRR